MNGSQVKPARASSARTPVLRPNSGKNRKIHQKTEFIDSVYGNNQLSQNSGYYNSFHKNKQLSTKFQPVQAEQEDVSKLIPKGDQLNKQRQQLFEQNLHLKKQINRLKDELNKSKTKIEMLLSKNNKYTKQYNRQFEKKIYWTGNNSHLISGVKAQYEKLLQQYNQKQQQCQFLRRQAIQSRAAEFKIYAEALQEQNNKLNERIYKLAEVSQQVLFERDGEKRISQHLVVQLQTKLERIQDKYKQSQRNIKISKQENSQLKKKVEFLEKLLIQKDNNQYHASKRAKKAEKQKLVLELEIKEMEGQRQDAVKNYETKIEKLRTVQEKRFRTEKDIFDRAISQKDSRIQKLEKEVAYLSTLLTYWKPLDEINQDKGEQEYSDEEDFKQIDLSKQKEKKKKTDEVNFVLQPKNSQLIPKSRRVTVAEFEKNQFILKSGNQPKSVNNSIKLQNDKKRTQQTADKKHSENAQKKRKLDYKQVQHIGEHLKYRFLGLRLHMNDIKKYFDFQKSHKNPQTNIGISNRGSQNADTQWDEQYINMGEVKQILMQQPFQLSEQDSHLLSRYMIEDSLNEFVYVDLKNENRRNVVKSIVKALVGDYQILQGQRYMTVEKECKDMLDKYQGNLLSALSTLASSGLISRKKFVELLSSLGIEVSEEGKDFLVCKMLLKSQSLNKLNYMIILD